MNKCTEENKKKIETNKAATGFLLACLVLLPLAAKGQSGAGRDDDNDGKKSTPEMTDNKLFHAQVGANNTSILMCSPNGKVSFLNNTYLNASTSTDLGGGFQFNTKFTELINVQGNTPDGLSATPISVVAGAEVHKRLGNYEFVLDVSRNPTELSNFCNVSAPKYVSETMGAQYIDITEMVGLKVINKDGNFLQLGYVATDGQSGNIFFIPNPKGAEFFTKIGTRGLDVGHGWTTSSSVEFRGNPGDDPQILGGVAVKSPDGKTQMSFGGNGHIGKDDMKLYANLYRKISESMDALVSLTYDKDKTTITAALDNDMEKGKIQPYVSVSIPTSSNTTTTTTGNIGVSYTIGASTRTK